MDCNAHHTLYGFIKILTRIYSDENDRKNSLGVDIITVLFKQAFEKMKSKHNNIWANEVILKEKQLHGNVSSLLIVNLKVNNLGLLANQIVIRH